MWYFKKMALVLSLLTICVSADDVPYMPCGYNATGTRVLHVWFKLGKIIEESLCDEYVAWHRSLDDPFGIRFITRSELFGLSAWARELNEDRYVLFRGMLERQEKSLDVFAVDAQWVMPLAGWLAELDLDITNEIHEKWIRRSPDTGKPVSLTTIFSQTVFYYRKDLFDDHGLSWPGESWDEFDRVVGKLQEKLRRAREEDNYFAFIIPTDDSVNRMMYMLITLLSGADGGNVVENNGQVTINNPNARRAIERWRDWFGSIVSYDAFGYSTSDSRRDFFAGKAAVILDWSANSDKMVDKNKEMWEEGWNIAAAPVPGARGAGCAGDWSIVINKFTERKPEAMKFMRFFTQNGLSMNIKGEHNAPGYAALNPENPEVWDKYCERNPVLCASVERYPAFWERLVHRPSAGCGDAYDSCTQLVYRYLNQFFKGSESSAEPTLQALEKELRVVMRLDDPVTDSDDLQPWRIALIIVAINGAVALMVVFAWVWVTLKQMRPARVCTVPVSLLFGGSALLVLASLSAALVGIQHSATEDLSRELNARVRTQSLLSMESVIASTVDGLRAVPGVSPAHVVSMTVAVATTSLGRLQIDSLSLVVVIDQKNGNVLISSDLGRQPVGRPSEHPWLVAALDAVPGWNTPIVPTESQDVTPEGWKSVTFNMLSVGLGSESGLTSEAWLLVYLTPREVIMGRSDRALEQAFDISVAITIGAVVLAAVGAAALARPLAVLAAQMDRVSVMDVEHVLQEQHSRSMLSEVHALVSGFRSMCRMLMEYKTFLPNTLFVGDDVHSSSDIAQFHGRRHPPLNNGTAVIAFTDIHGATSLWETSPNAMHQAVVSHDSVVRDCIKATAGYEVKAMDSSFMVSFDSVTDACCFALKVQEALYDYSRWPKELMQNEAMRKEGPWNGPRLRIGIGVGQASVEESALSGCAEYLGPAVTIASGVESRCVPGCVAVPASLVSTLDLQDVGDPVVMDLGYAAIKGSGPTKLMLLIPLCLRSRETDVLAQLAERSNRSVLSSSARSVAFNPLLASPDRAEEEAAPRGSGQPVQLPSALKESLKKTRAGTVCAVKVATSFFSGMEHPLPAVRELLSCCIGAAERCEGSFVSLCSGTTVFAWNTVRRTITHIARGARFLVLLYRTMSHGKVRYPWTERTGVGMATGSLLHGNVRAPERKQHVVLGTTVELAVLLSGCSRRCGAFSLLCSLPGHNSLNQDHVFRSFVRPVDIWDLKPHPCTVYQLNADLVDRIQQIFIFRESDPSWGWTKEYTEAFDNRDYDTIRKEAGDADRVAHVVAGLLESGTHLVDQLPETGYEEDVTSIAPPLPHVDSWMK